jgi:hypothetical protein
MFFLAGIAASSALDLISSLQQSLGKTSGTSGQTGAAFDPGAATAASTPAVNGSGPSTPLAPGTMNALLAVQGQPGVVNGDAFSAQLFSLLDANSDGSISKSEFESALAQNGNTSQADSIFAQLDANGDGTVSQDELTSALQNSSGAVQPHHHHHNGGAGALADGGGGTQASGQTGSGGTSDPLTGPDTSQTVTNADGSTTTTITYADGSQVTLTTPAAGSGGATAAANNYLEKLIARQAQMIAASSGQSLVMSA